MSDFWRRLARNRGAVIGLALLALVVLVAVLAPLLYQQSPWRMVQRPFLPPMALDGFWFGTDTLGRSRPSWRWPSAFRSAPSPATSAGAGTMR